MTTSFGKPMISDKMPPSSGAGRFTRLKMCAEGAGIAYALLLVLAVAAPGLAEELAPPADGPIVLTPPAATGPIGLTGSATFGTPSGELADDFAEVMPGPRLIGDIIGETFEQYTWSSDTLLDLARADNLGLIELMAANPGIDPWVPGKASRIVMPTAHIVPDTPREGIIINLADLRLYYFGEDGRVETFPIGVGREGFTTPLGRTKVARKKEAPSWYPTANARAEDPELPAVVGPGPDNPLGEFALYLGWPTYLVHGTSKPWGVGRRVSRGCIRLYPEDIAWLFENVEVGTPVTVVDQPIKIGRRNGELFLEVHPTPEQQNEIERSGYATSDPAPDMTDAILTAAGDDFARIDWQSVDSALIRRQGIPVQITTPLTQTLSAPSNDPDYAAR